MKSLKKTLILALGVSFGSYAQNITWKNKIHSFQATDTVTMHLNYDARPLSFLYLDAKLLEVDAKGNVVNTYNNSQPMLKTVNNNAFGTINFKYIASEANPTIKQKLPKGHFYKLTAFMILNNSSEFEYKSDYSIIKLKK